MHDAGSLTPHEQEMSAFSARPQNAALHRLRQFIAALTAHVAIDERVLVVTTLGPGELRLFERMPRFDQRHCLDVYHTLVRAGHTNPILLRAALIHDCGKVGDDGRPIPLFLYGVFVILKRFAPQLYTYAVRDARGPLRFFAIHEAHDRRGAALAEAVGSPPAVVQILRDYADRRSTEATRLLLWADTLN
jgi:hypothetical protein